MRNFHLTSPQTIEKMLEVVSIKMFQDCEQFFKNLSNPALWGILKWKVRSFFYYSSQSWNFEIFQASDDTFGIFDIDANDDLVQAWWKFLKMLEFFPHPSWRIGWILPIYKRLMNFPAILWCFRDPKQERSKVFT